MSTEEHTSTCLQFLRPVVVAVGAVLSILVAALPRIVVVVPSSAVAVVVSSEH
jgi:hypothetical protein